MLKKWFIVPLALFSSAPAYADLHWKMYGPDQFQPEDPDIKYQVFNTGGRTTAAGYVRSIVDLPIGAQLLYVYCQLYDVSTTQNINVNLMERATDDNVAIASTGRVIFFFNSSGNPGYVKYGSTTPDGSNVIKDWELISGSVARYYSYRLRVRLDGTTSTALKSCAIGYDI